MSPTLSEDPRKGGVETWGVGNRASENSHILHQKKPEKVVGQEKNTKTPRSKNEVSSNNKKDDDDAPKQLTIDFHLQAVLKKENEFVMACEAADSDDDEVMDPEDEKVEKKRKNQKLCRAVHHSAFTS